MTAILIGFLVGAVVGAIAGAVMSRLMIGEWALRDGDVLICIGLAAFGGGATSGLVAGIA